MGSMLGGLHDTLAEQGIDKTRIKTRAIAVDHSVVGEAAVDAGKMVHIELRLLEGRDEETKMTYGKAVHQAAKSRIADTNPDAAITLEVRDMTKATYILS